MLLLSLVFNLFVPNAFFLYPWKTSENHTRINPVTISPHLNQPTSENGMPIIMPTFSRVAICKDYFDDTAKIEYIKNLSNSLWKKEQLFAQISLSFMLLLRQLTLPYAPGCHQCALTFYLLLLFFYHFKIPIMGLEVFYEYICNEITLQLYFFASVTSII